MCFRVRVLASLGQFSLGFALRVLRFGFFLHHAIPGWGVGVTEHKHDTTVENPVSIARALRQPLPCR